jgi:hypothetical protein
LQLSLALVPDHRSQPRRVALLAERGSDLSLNAVLTQQRRDQRRIDKHVLVVFAVTAPRPVGVRQECRDVANEPVRAGIEN